ncbi:MAG: HEPN domain-containing protein [Candidatus Omnitrophica bacterium]|nr:HEPN domain-containing protein [Candidatus Omnitrophota bacterium]
MISFKNCLEKKRIFRFEPAKHLVDLEIKDAQSDLSSAREEFSESGFKWATIKGYYAMFHSARALLYSRGYREKGHYCLYLALKEFFVQEKKLDPMLAEDFNNSMILREDADYRRKFSQEGSQAVIESAKEFLKATEEILSKEKEKWNPAG